MQGYVTPEPFAIEQIAKFKPGVILLADYGFNTYSTLIETRRISSTRSRIWFSVSSTPRSSVGTIICTATTRQATR